MRVLHVIDSLGGSGGAEHGLVREITRFSAEVDQQVCRLFSKDHLEAALTAAGIPVTGLNLSAGQAAYAWPVGVSRLRSIVRSFRPDVIHSSLFTANLVAQITGIMARKAVLSTFTLSGDVDLLKSHQPGADRWRATALRAIAARPARSRRVWFRSLTQDALETNCRLLGVPLDRATVIPRGVPAPVAPTKSRLELGLPAEGYLLLNTGRQTSQKGHLYLLEALAKVRQRLDAHLVIAGREGEATNSIRTRIADLGLGQHVTLLGYTPDLPRYLGVADLFVFTSLMEGLGTAVLEAMAARVPVVAFDIPPVREATDGGRGGRLVPVGDTSGFAVAIEEMLDTVKSSSYVQAGTELVAGRYSLPTVARQVEDLLRKVAFG